MKILNKNKKIIFGIIVLVSVLFFLGKLNNVTVTLNVNGQPYETGNVNKGNLFEEPKNPEKEGYTFEGWYLGDEKFDFTKPIIEDIELEARFILKKYDITITNGNGEIITETVNHGEKLSEPEKPISQGYTFIGWYVDDEKFDFDTPITGEIELQARWVENEYSTYTVEHYLMDKDGNYGDKPYEKQLLIGKTNSVIRPNTKNYKGYVTPQTESIKVTLDGEAIVKYYYEVGRYTLTILGDNGVETVTGSGTYYYGDEVTIDYNIKNGYSFESFSEQVINNVYTMPDKDMVINIVTKPNPNFEYTVEHYLMDLNGKYNEPFEVETLTGATDSVVKPETKNYPGFTSPEMSEITVSIEGSVLKYYYTRNKYSITFNTNGGSGIDSMNIYYGSLLTKPVPSKVGHTFVSWYTDEEFNNEFDFTKPMDSENINLYAKWNVNSYTIAFDSNGGSAIDAITSSFGTVVTKPTDPTKPGYTFMGWYSDKELNNPYTFTTMPSDGITVYAKWEINKYNISFDSNGGTGTMSNQIFTHDVKDKLNINTFVRNGYIFKGWSLEKNGVVTYNDSAELKFDGDKTLYAVWEIINYSISYELNGGIGQNPTKYTVEDNIILNKLTKLGYTFIGFEINGQMSDEIVKGTTGNLTIKAIFEANTDTKYKVEHYQMNLNGEYTNPFEVENLTGTTDTKVKPSVKTYTGFTSPSESEVVIKADGTTVVKYYYERNKYTLTLEYTQGIEGVSGNGTHYYGEEVRIEAIVSRGFTFKTWTMNDTLYSSDLKTTVKIENNMKLTATTTLNEYKITFDSNGGSEVDEIISYYGAELIKPVNPIKTEYKFIGWFEENSTIEFDFTKPMTDKNIKLFAKWEINPNTIIFETNGGSAIEPLTQEAGSIVNAPINPIKTGYNFIGWFIDADLNNPYSFTTMPVEGIIVYAKWEVKTYNVSFDSNGGTGTMASQVFKYDTLDKLDLNKFTKEGYEFVGWSNDVNGDILYQNNAEIKIESDKTLYAIWKTVDYKITYKLNGGVETTNQLTYTIEDSITLNSPFKTGYDFKAWIINGNITNEIVKGTTGDLTIEAIYEASKNTKYTVEHYQMDLNGEYTSVFERENLTGTTDTKVKPSVKTYTGFTSPSASEVVIKADGTTVVKYYYERNKYTLTVNKGVGVSSVTGSGTYYYGTEVNVTSVIAEGYTFTSWSNGSKLQNITYKIESNATLIPNTMVNNYKITYDLDGGIANNPTKYTVEDTIILNAPTKTGYTFKGFEINGQMTNIISKGTTGNLTVKAIYEPNTNTKYIVEHYQMDLNGKYTNVFETENLTGTTDTKVKPSVKTYTGFTSPSASEVVIKADGTTVVKYYYERNKYTLTINKTSGIDSVTGSGTYYYGTEVNVSATINNNYTFAGWSNGIKLQSFTYKLLNNTTLTANASAISYTITYDLAGGVVSKANPTKYTVEDNITLNTPTKNGYTFKGYEINGQMTNVISKGTTGNLTVKAIYEPNTNTKYKVEHYQMDLNGKYTNVFETENLTGTTDTKVKPSVKTYTGFTSPNATEVLIKADGTTVVKYYYERNKYTLTVNKGVGISSVTGSGTYYYGTEVNVSATVMTGYVFEKWSNGNTTNSIKLLSNTTLTASAKPIEYQVKYNGNGSNAGSMANSTHKYDVNSNLSANTLIKNYVITYVHYSGKNENVNVANNFLGWATSSNGTVVYNDKQSIVNLANTQGTVINLYAKWSNPTTNLMTPTRDGYVFVGWSTTSDGKNIISNENYKLNGNITLYGVWKLIPAVESLSFDVYKDSSAKEKYDSKDTFAKGDKAFFVKLPEDGHLNVNSIKVLFNTPITLNTEAVSSSNYLDVIANSQTQVSLVGNSINVKTTDGGLTWVGSSTRPMLTSVNLFLQVIGSQYGGKNIGIAEGFGISIDNGLTTPHYVSTRKSINGNTYLFFAREGTPYVTITFVNGSNKLVSVSVPKGSVAPDIGEIKLNGYNFKNWYSNSNLTSTFDFTKPIYENTVIYGNYEMGDIDISWYDSNKTTFNISTAKQLRGFAALASNGTSFSGKTVNLINNIDLENENWTPITSFNGTFNGNYYTISNLKITDAKGSVGFFAKLTSTATVTKLKFKNVTFDNSTASQSGTVAGTSSGAKIEKISVDNITINGQTNAGGIVGSSNGGTIINECSVTNGTVSVSATDAGGILGSSSGNLTLTNLYANVTVSSDSIAAPDTGGILGSYTNASNALTMKYIIFTGKVSTSSFIYNTAGAIYGRIGTGSTGNSSYDNDKFGNKTNWFYDTNKYGTGSKTELARGTGKTTTELQTVSTYASWDANIWNIISGKYPTLKMK